MPRRPDRRAYRDAPYIDDKVASEARRQAAPRGFAGLLRWFLEGFWAETPERVHVEGVWFGRPPRLDAAGQAVEEIPSELVGGSQLGAPKQAEPFRQLIENSPRQTSDDGADEHYVRPMRAALSQLARRDDGPLMARFLAQVAYAQGDWPSVAARWFPAYPIVHRPFTEHALRRLYGSYRGDPPVRYIARPIQPVVDERPVRVIGPGWVSMSESQRSAIEAGEKGVA